jgi:hypothetical protein
MTVLVNWANDNGGDLPLRSAWECEKYTVDATKNACGPGKDGVRLLLDDGKHDIYLGTGSRAYVMNSHGATIDRIVV